MRSMPAGQMPGKRCMCWLLNKFPAEGDLPQPYQIDLPPRMKSSRRISLRGLVRSIEFLSILAVSTATSIPPSTAAAIAAAEAPSARAPATGAALVLLARFLGSPAFQHRLP